MCVLEGKERDFLKRKCYITSLAFHIQARQPFAHKNISEKYEEERWVDSLLPPPPPYRRLIETRNQIIITQAKKAINIARKKKQNKSQWIGKNFQFFYITRNFFVFAINPSNFSSPYIYINKRITRSKRVYFMYRRLNLEREIPTLESNKIDNFFGSQYKLLSHCQHQQIFFLF